MALRIGFDVSPLSVSRSGVGTYTARLLEQLVQGPDTILPLSHLPAENGGAKMFNKTIWMQFRLAQQIRQIQPDLCHFTNHVAPLWFPLPYILTIHDMTLWLYASTHPVRRLVSMRPLIPFAARRAAAIITVSHSAKNDIVRLLGVPREKIHVIYEAPGQAFRPLLEPRRLARRNDPRLMAVRRAYNLPPNYLLHVGTLEPRKNLVRLMEAFAQLRRHGVISHHLVLVGHPGWKWRELLAAVERLDLNDAVHFLGYVPDRKLPAIYNLADLLVYPSIYEGFGLPVIEAMASGLPVVTTPNGALSEVAGEAAMMVNPIDVDDIARGIHRVVSDRQLCEVLRARGLARARRFSWSKTAEETRHIYGRVAEAAKQPKRWKPW